MEKFDNNTEEIIKGNENIVSSSETPKDVFNKMSPEEGSGVSILKEEGEKSQEKESKISQLKANIMSMFGKSPEKLEEMKQENIKKGLEKVSYWINRDDAFRDSMAELKKDHPERIDDYLEALGKYQYVKWDEQKGKYVDSGKYTETQNSLQ